MMVIQNLGFLTFVLIALMIHVDMVGFSALIILFALLARKCPDPQQTVQLKLMVLGLVIWLACRLIWRIGIEDLGKFISDDSVSLSDAVTFIALFVSLSAIGLLIFVYSLWRLAQQWDNTRTQTKAILLGYGIINLISSLLLFAIIGIFPKIFVVPILGALLFAWLFKNVDNLLESVSTDRTKAPIRKHFME